MDKGLMDKLSVQNLEVKQFIDWNEAYQQQELTLNLQQLKSRLEAELAQSIESHVIRKQKTLEQLSKAIEVILDIKKKTSQALQTETNPKSANHNPNDVFSAEDNLENLVQLISIKNHVDYCLEKLEPIVNNENTEDNNQDNENED